MGFLTKFFSLGGKRSKRQWKEQQAAQFAAEASTMPVTRRNQEEHEATVNRLLRSSSASLATLEEQAEVATLAIPPFTQQHTGQSTMSTTSLASTCRSTYTVTVYPRIVLAIAEFPNANPEIPHTPSHDSLRRRSKSLPMNAAITPKDKARLLGLHADPSVASLLNMYDEHGCLDSKVFSNSPSPRQEGRPQTQRTGSTLRELLGGPSSMSSRQGHERNSSAMEGDISWAERWLESANTSTSSLIRTPNDAHFDHDRLNDKLSESRDKTVNQSDLFPVFSSLEVELSQNTEDTLRTPTKFADNPYISNNYIAPRATEVFDFLITRKRRPYSQPEERSFERECQILTEPNEPQSRFSAYSSVKSKESDESLKTNTRASAPTEDSDIKTPTMPENVPSWPSSSKWIAHDSTAKKFREDPEDNSMMQDGPKLHEVVANSAAEAQANRRRGPRPPSTRKSGSSKSSEKPLYYEPPCDTRLHQDMQSNAEYVFQNDSATASAPDLSMAIDVDTFSPETTLRYSHSNTASRTSAVFPHVPALPALATHKPVAVEAPYIPKHIRRKQPPSKWAQASAVHDKENSNRGSQDAIARGSAVPKTPVRNSIFRAALDNPPSPASSSDLSPLAQQLMEDLRSQRKAARPRYKRPGSTNQGKWSTTTSKLKF